MQHIPRKVRRDMASKKEPRNGADDRESAPYFAIPDRAWFTHRDGFSQHRLILMVADVGLPQPGTLPWAGGGTVRAAGGTTATSASNAGQDLGYFFLLPLPEVV